MKFDNQEKKIIELSVKRYTKPFFKWGHYLSWLAPALVLLSQLSVFKSYSGWMLWLAVFLLFEWYFVVTTRVIGKLKDALDLGKSTTSKTNH